MMGSQVSCAKAVKRAASRRRIARELLSSLPPSGTSRELYSCTMYDADKGIRTGYCHDDMIARRRGHTQQASRRPCKGLLKAGSVEILGADLNAEA